MLIGTRRNTPSQLIDFDQVFMARLLPKTINTSLLEASGSCYDDVHAAVSLDLAFI